MFNSKNRCVYESSKVVNAGGTFQCVALGLCKLQEGDREKDCGAMGDGDKYSRGDQCAWYAGNNRRDIHFWEVVRQYL